mmetsp:Transcript_3016/g.4592  ORF Transcript_3016/g.4592 Transcript_3016/m.4592 type:complete len:207 (-) Transcript_3016:2876-3496(-)
MNDIRSKYHVITGQSIHFHLSHCNAVCMIVKRLSLAGIPVVPYAWRHIEALCRKVDALHVCSIRNIKPGSVRHLFSYGLESLIDYVASIEDCKAIHIRSYRPGRGGRVGHLVCTGLGYINLCKWNTERISCDLCALDMKSLAHLCTRVREQHRSVLVNEDMSTRLVNSHKTGRHSVVDRIDTDAPLLECTGLVVLFNRLTSRVEVT